jgi:hypothetical protein
VLAESEWGSCFHVDAVLGSDAGYTLESFRLHA